jgi:hypothetical protein
MAGNKRAAVSSPAITPPGPSMSQTPPSTTDEGDICEEELKPARLEDKFGVPLKKRSTQSSFNSPAPQHDNSSDDRINFLDPKIYEKLMSEPKPLTPGQWLPYEFNEEDDITMKLRDMEPLRTTSR